LIQGKIRPDFEDFVNVDVSFGKVNFRNSQGAVIDGFHTENFLEGSLESNNLGVNAKGLEIIDVFFDDGIDVLNWNIRLFQEFRNIRRQKVPACVFREIVIDVESCHAEHDDQYYDDYLFYRRI
jgi:hypothetical protein